MRSRLRQWWLDTRAWLDRRVPSSSALRRTVLALGLVVLLILGVAGLITAFGEGGGGPSINIDAWACSSASDNNGLIEVRGSGFTPGGTAQIVAVSGSKLVHGLARTPNVQGRTIWLFKCRFGGQVAFTAADMNAKKTASATITVDAQK